MGLLHSHRSFVVHVLTSQDEVLLQLTKLPWHSDPRSYCIHRSSHNFWAVCSLDSKYESSCLICEFLTRVEIVWLDATFQRNSILRLADCTNAIWDQMVPCPLRFLLANVWTASEPFKSQQKGWRSHHLKQLRNLDFRRRIQLIPLVSGRVLDAR